MKVYHSLMCFFFLALQVGNTGLISAGNHIITEKEGGNMRHGCNFKLSGKRRLFCRKECEEKDILIDTTEVRVQRGRYSIDYTEGTYPVFSTVLYVSITNLTKSDSGQYRCSLDRKWFIDGTEDFELKVEDAPVTSKPKLISRPFSTSLPSASTLTRTTTTTTITATAATTTTAILTTTQSLSSSSGSYSSSSVSTETTKQSQQPQTAEGSDVLLYVGLTLVVMVIMLSLAVLILCRRRIRKPREPPSETDYADVTQANRVYEEIREEDRQRGSPPVEISTVYTCVKYTKPNAVETADDYSLVTAAASQDKPKDDSGKFTYSEVDFSNGAASYLSSAPRGDVDNVIYSVPRVEASSNGSPAEGAAAPLYSTVSLIQQ